MPRICYNPIVGQISSAIPSVVSVVSDPRILSITTHMPTFRNKKFVPSSAANLIGVRYRPSPLLFSSFSISLIPETGSSLNRHPFLLFGLPFIATILAGSFFLTPVTAIRYDKYDRKVQRMSQEEAMGLEKGRRKIDMNEEYYVSEPL